MGYLREFLQTDFQVDAHYHWDCLPLCPIWYKPFRGFSPMENAVHISEIVNAKVGHSTVPFVTPQNIFVMTDAYILTRLLTLHINLISLYPWKYLR